MVIAPHPQFEEVEWRKKTRSPAFQGQKTTGQDPVPGIIYLFIYSVRYVCFCIVLKKESLDFVNIFGNKGRKVKDLRKLCSVIISLKGSLSQRS